MPLTSSKILQRLFNGWANRDTLVPQYETDVYMAAQANQKPIALSRAL
jgi:hypothetical protein